jgi:superfamily II DNA or RNA helicase
VIVPNKSLVEQTLDDYVNCQLDVGVYYGDRKDFGKMHTICTWQSLNILEKRFKDHESTFGLDEFLEGVSAVIVDEVHQAKAEVLKTILTRNLSHCPIRWGLTGTVPKEAFEFQSILASLGPVVGSVTAKELQDKGILSSCHVNICQLIDIKEFRDYQAELKYLVTDEQRLNYISKLLLKIKDSGNTLILVDRITAGEQLQKLIPGSVFINGSVKTKDRKETYDEVQEADDMVIIATYGVAAVGINIPRIFNLVLFEPGKSFVRVIQSIGRGVRKAKDKDFVQIWDITSTCKYAKKHLTERKKFYKDAQYPFTIEKIDWKK